MNIRLTLYNARSRLGAAGRLLAMVMLLRPASVLLPRRGADFVASICGFLAALSCASWKRIITNRRVFSLSWPASFRLVHQSQSLPFTDYVFERRLVRGLEHPARWKVTDTNAADVHNLLQSGQSFILATGHFCREAISVLYLPRWNDHTVVGVVASLEPLSWDLCKLKMRIQFREALLSLKAVNSDIILLSRGAYGSGMRDLVTRLRQGGSVLINSIDAHWSLASGIRAPFASERARPLSTGAAAISRMSQCPVVACIPVLDGPQRVRLEWGPVIQPPRRNDRSADERITIELLKFLEKGVGRRPDQYVLPIVGERRWDAAKERWIDMADASRPQALMTPTTG